MKSLKFLILGLAALFALGATTGCKMGSCTGDSCSSSTYEHDWDPWYDGDDWWNDDDYYDDDDYYGDDDYYDDDYYDDDYYWEKTKPVNKDRLKISAAEEKKLIEKGAENINARFGLSTERSFEISKLAMAWKKLPKERQTKTEKENFEKAVLGYTVTEYQAAIASKVMGDGEDLKEMLKETAEMNGTTPENLNNIIANETSKEESAEK